MKNEKNSTEIKSIDHRNRLFYLAILKQDWLGI